VVCEQLSFASEQQIKCLNKSIHNELAKQQPNLPDLDGR
jgi:hypothetical protein